MASGKESPPSLSERQTCHKARDAYFECLDASNERKEACENLMKAMEAVCRPTWVKHFEQKRIADQYKKKLESLPKN